MHIWLFITLLLIILLIVYLVWIRPALKTRPSLAQFYAQEQSVWGALKLKFTGIRQKITTAVVMIAGVVVTSYDFFVPLVEQAGVDVKQLVTFVPPWAWPLVTMSLLALVQYFRNLNDQKVAALLEAHNLEQPK